MALQVIVADDHPMIRAGVKSALAAYDIEVSGETDSESQLLELLDQSTFHVVLLDVRLRPADGFAVLKNLRTRYPQLPVVMFSGYSHPNFVAQAHHLGALGFIPKGASAEKYAEVIRAAANRQASYSVEELRRIHGAYSSQRLNEDYDAALTRREVEILAFMAEGNTNKKIAERLAISSETVKEHVQHVLQKIGVSDRTQAVYWGITHGVLKL
jgi:DNA-binding NarL/FixJ family response regulator